MKSNGEIIIYQSPTGNIKIDVRLENETVWLTQKLMAELFQTTVPNINIHLKSIYEEEELAEGATIKDFLIVQNKLLWAISTQTAAELVYRRADASLPLLGMQSYDKDAVGKIKKSDVSIAKNYLNEEEIKLLGLLVEQYLAFAETMAQQHTPMYMKDWISRLDNILQMNGRELLTHAGKISHQMAIEKSNQELERYNEEQKKITHEQSLKEIEEDIKRLKNETDT